MLLTLECYAWENRIEEKELPIKFGNADDRISAFVRSPTIPRVGETIYLTGYPSTNLDIDDSVSYDDCFKGVYKVTNVIHKFDDSRFFNCDGEAEWSVSEVNNVTILLDWIA